MAKYNEVMEHIEVTEEMQSRILRNVDQHFRKEKKTAGRKWLPVLGTVAAAAVLLLVIRPWNYMNITNEPEQPAVQGTYYEQEYPSAEELSEAVGFEINEISSLPFEVTETAYSDISGIAEITYTGGENSLVYRKSAGTEDNSGDYTEYPAEETADLGGVTVTMKGEQDKMCLAIWTDGTYSYSLFADPGLEKETLSDIAAEIMEKN